jgi:hypothetical protein
MALMKDARDLGEHVLRYITTASSSQSGIGGSPPAEKKN